MAHRVQRRVIHNPGKLSDKQIKFFGTPAQKAALKRRRASRRNAGMRKRKTGGLFRRKRSMRIHKPATRPRRVMRSNPGEILSLVANPARKRAKPMAQRKRKRAASKPARRSRLRRMSARPAHRRRLRSNPSRVIYRTRHAQRRVHHRRNAGGGGTGITGLFTNALWLIGGAVGTKMITQLVLQTNNAGFMGYIGNAVTAFGLSLVVGKLFKNPRAGQAVLAGGIVALVLRLIADYTPLGQYTSSLGLGDYQVSNWVTPQRYVDALNSAQVEIPAGWAPTTVVQSAAPPAGAGGSGMGGGLYGSGGLYSA